MLSLTSRRVDLMGLRPQTGDETYEVYTPTREALRDLINTDHIGPIALNCFNI